MAEYRDIQTTTEDAHELPKHEFLPDDVTSEPVPARQVQAAMVRTTLETTRPIEEVAEGGTKTIQVESEFTEPGISASQVSRVGIKATVAVRDATTTSESGEQLPPEGGPEEQNATPVLAQGNGGDRQPPGGETTDTASDDDGEGEDNLPEEESSEPQGAEKKTILYRSGAPIIEERQVGMATIRVALCQPNVRDIQTEAVIKTAQGCDVIAIGSAGKTAEERDQLGQKYTNFLSTVSDVELARQTEAELKRPHSRYSVPAALLFEFKNSDKVVQVIDTGEEGTIYPLLRGTDARADDAAVTLTPLASVRAECAESIQETIRSHQERDAQLAQQIDKLGEKYRHGRGGKPVSVGILLNIDHQGALAKLGDDASPERASELKKKAQEQVAPGNFDAFDDPSSDPTRLAELTDSMLLRSYIATHVLDQAPKEQAGDFATKIVNRLSQAQRRELVASMERITESDKDRPTKAGEVKSVLTRYIRLWFQ